MSKPINMNNKVFCNNKELYIFYFFNYIFIF